MNKQAIIDLLIQNHQSFIDYTNALTPDDYMYSYEQKWTAGQQLEHIVLCVKPLVQVFGMDTPVIEQNFGVADKPSRSYEGVLNEYRQKLRNGGKAPDRYVPKAAEPEQRTMLSTHLKRMIRELVIGIESFTEEELDGLCIPHPLLGKLTLREMLYNAIYHVEHHHTLTRQNLENKKGSNI